MIFVTVGTQLAFERMTSAVDDWAARHPEVQVFAQVGPTRAMPKNLPARDFLSPSEAAERAAAATLIVAHAGMGSVLTALQLCKPIVIMPRHASLGEHRNDHQLATARWLQGRPGIHVAWDEAGLWALLDARDSLLAGDAIAARASGTLVDHLKQDVMHAIRRRT